MKKDMTEDEITESKKFKRQVATKHKLEIKNQPVWKILLEHVRKLVEKKYKVHSEQSVRFSFDYEDLTFRLTIGEYYVVNMITIQALGIVAIDGDEDELLAILRSEVPTATFYIDDMEANGISCKVQTVVDNKSGYTIRVHDSLCSTLLNAIQKANYVAGIHKTVSVSKNHK